MDKKLNYETVFDNYNIVWKQCPCLEGVRLEDVTPELSDLAYNEVKNS